MRSKISSCNIECHLKSSTGGMFLSTYVMIFCDVILVMCKYQFFSLFYCSYSSHEHSPFCNIYISHEDYLVLGVGEPAGGDNPDICGHTYFCSGLNPDKGVIEVHV